MVGVPGVVGIPGCIYPGVYTRVYPPIPTRVYLLYPPGCIPPLPTRVYPSLYPPGCTSGCTTGVHRVSHGCTTGVHRVSHGCTSGCERCTSGCERCTSGCVTPGFHRGFPWVPEVHPTIITSLSRMCQNVQDHRGFNGVSA